MSEMTEEDKTPPSAADLGIRSDQPRTHGEAVTRLADAMFRYAVWPATATAVVGLMVLREITWLHTKSLAFTMLAVVIVWAAMDTVAFRRTKLPTLIISSDDQ